MRCGGPVAPPHPPLGSHLVTLGLHLADVGQLGVCGEGIHAVLGQDAQQGTQLQPPLPQGNAVPANTHREKIVIMLIN